RTSHPAIPIRSLFVATLAVILPFVNVSAQVAKPLSVLQGEPAQEMSLNFRDAPLELVLNTYSEITGRTMIMSQGIAAIITLRGQTRMTESNVLRAIESILQMNNIALVPMGDLFLKVVQPTAIRQEGLPIISEMPEEPF